MKTLGQLLEISHRQWKKQRAAINKKEEKSKLKKELSPEQIAKRRMKARERHWNRTGAGGAVGWMKRNNWL